ncbi:hypothetical protein PF005_g15278 [Phytophthora fragariae]|uniref:Ubiquitin-like protease family profile domain-containing protein n=2 Tax=Phytophthora fragariae TaxID=53985 RepID=A0A6A4D4C0_9STRA|nr:hypothetical protein PF005_g15278 [Phytophthora fragariae]KAE9301092.1 hypothetical protein PF001_g14608 [Phytophthora fragariae]
MEADGEAASSNRGLEGALAASAVCANDKHDTEKEPVNFAAARKCAESEKSLISGGRARPQDTGIQCSVDRKFRYDKMAKEIMLKYDLATLTSKYSLRSKIAFIHFEEVVGAVARTEWLIGAAVNYGVAAICDWRQDCFVLSSHDLDGHFSTDRSLFSFKLVIVPVNSHGMHWTVVLVSIDNGSISVHFYDPLGSSAHFKELKLIWNNKLLPFLVRWDTHRRTYANETCELPPHVPEHRIERPLQPDDGSCGIMVLAMVHTYVRVSTRGFKLDTVTVDYVKVLRLRFLWFVMRESVIHPKEKSDEDASHDTDAELVNAFKLKRRGQQ